MKFNNPKEVVNIRSHLFTFKSCFASKLRKKRFQNSAKLALQAITLIVCIVMCTCVCSGVCCVRVRARVVYAVSVFFRWCCHTEQLEIKVSL